MTDFQTCNNHDAKPKCVMIPWLMYTAAREPNYSERNSAFHKFSSKFSFLARNLAWTSSCNQQPTSCYAVLKEVLSPTGHLTSMSPYRVQMAPDVTQSSKSWPPFCCSMVSHRTSHAPSPCDGFPRSHQLTNSSYRKLQAVLRTMHGDGAEGGPRGPPQQVVGHLDSKVTWM